MQDKTGFGRSINYLICHESVEEEIRSTLLFQLVEQYGWKRQDAQNYIYEYLKMDQSKGFVRQICKKYNLYGKKVLEVGAGLGNILIQMKLNGINAVGIEPSKEYYEIIKKRLGQHNLDVSSVIKGYGENLPFDDHTFDFVLIMQVLEHVNDPEGVLAEINRVLRPGGICYITAPNYLSFRENHYRVFWFPMMPKFVAGWYLRLRVRDTSFLQNHINYITFLKVIRIATRLKWNNLTIKSFLEKFENPLQIRSKAKRILAEQAYYFSGGCSKKIGEIAYYSTNLFRPEITYEYFKP
jgi:ubiquinone/menaquinone biosynthesis C-methylase UbiE